jgi:hypothetical protein
MADIYIDDAAAGAATGADWANAFTVLDGNETGVGDSIYIASTHTEDFAALATLAFGGTLASPTYLYSTAASGAPPAAVVAGAQVNNLTTSSALTITGVLYAYGMTFKAGISSGNNRNLSFAQNDGDFQRYEDCTFTLGDTGTGCLISVGNSGGINQEHTVIWNNCNAVFANAAQKIQQGRGRFRWSGGAISGSAITTLLALAAPGTDILLEGLDLSAGAAGLVIFSAGAVGSGRAVIRNCKLPASWSGNVGAAPTAFNTRLELYNCDDGDTFYRLEIQDYAGNIIDDTSVYNDAGASPDGGTTRFSWKMTASANAEFPAIVLYTPEMVIWNDVVGSAQTVTVEVNHNSAGAGMDGALTDKECWLETQYLGTSGTPRSLMLTDKAGATTTIPNGDPLAAATDQTTSAAAWTGDAAGWDTQKLQVTFTAQEKGSIHVRVGLAVASAVVYIDPLPTVA